MPNSRYILVPWQGAAQRIALARPLPEVIRMPIGDGGTGMVELFRLTLTLTGRSMEGSYVLYVDPRLSKDIVLTKLDALAKKGSA